MAIPFIIGLASLVGLFLFLYLEIRRSPGPMEWKRTPKWEKRIRVTLAAIAAIGGCCVFWGFLIEPNRLVTHRETIQINNWPTGLRGIKIAVLSDLHVGSSFIDEQKVRLIVERTNELQPDLIVLLGDFMTDHRVPPEVFAPILKDFRAPLGTYAVLGNHDWWFDGNRVRRALETNGISVIDDEVMEINWRGTSFWLAGLADLWTRPQHIKGTIDMVPPNQPVIALTHNPDIFPDLQQTVPLLLAGHTHGGQVRLPIIGTVIQPSMYGQRYVRGHVFENNHHMFVTTGIGTSILPVRFGVTPEIVLLTVNSE